MTPDHPNCKRAGINGVAPDCPLLQPAAPPEGQEPAWIGSLADHDMPDEADIRAMRGQELPDAHTLTLQFGRFLSELEWREIVGQASKLPYVKGLCANAVASRTADVPDVRDDAVFQHGHLHEPEVSASTVPDIRNLAQEVIDTLWKRRADCADPDCECPLQDAWKDWHCIAQLRVALSTPAPARVAGVGPARASPQPDSPAGEAMRRSVA